VGLLLLEAHLAAVACLALGYELQQSATTIMYVQDVVDQFVVYVASYVVVLAS